MEGLIDPHVHPTRGRIARLRTAPRLLHRGARENPTQQEARTSNKDQGERQQPVDQRAWLVRLSSPSGPHDAAIRALAWRPMPDDKSGRHICAAERLRCRRRSPES